MKTIFLRLAASTILACAFLVLNTAPAWADGKKAVQHTTRNKIVIQISDDDANKWNSVLSNVRNVQNELGPKNVIIKVVAFGGGLGMLTLDSPVGGEVTDAMKTGIQFIACENTMKGRHLTRDDMLPDLEYAPAAIVKIMQLQQEGYAYVKP